MSMHFHSFIVNVFSAYELPIFVNFIKKETLQVATSLVYATKII